jgi:hypothetical protein
MKSDLFAILFDELHALLRRARLSVIKIRSDEITL